MAGITHNRIQSKKVNLSIVPGPAVTDDKGEEVRTGKGISQHTSSPKDCKLMEISGSGIRNRKTRSFTKELDAGPVAVDILAPACTHNHLGMRNMFACTFDTVMSRNRGPMTISGITSAQMKVIERRQNQGGRDSHTTVAAPPPDANHAAITRRTARPRRNTSSWRSENAPYIPRGL